jgi:hypothetical protein
MNETIELDKIIDNNILNILPINMRPELAHMIKVLHENRDIKFKLILVLNERILNDDDPFGGIVGEIGVGIFLVAIRH